MGPTDDDLGFSVVDRRQRADADAESPPATAAPAPSSPPPASAVGPVAAEPRGEPGSPDFASFCYMLYEQALFHLGQYPDPTTGQSHLDLDQARLTIDILGMLEEKTTGNLTAEESAVLQEILANLRLGFVRLSRGS